MPNRAANWRAEAAAAGKTERARFRKGYDWDNPDGSVHVRRSVGKIHWDAGGTWADIDTDWQPVTPAAPGDVQPYDWWNDQNDWDYVAIRENIADADVLRFAKGGEWVSLDPQSLQWTNDLDQIQPIADPTGTDTPTDNDLTWLNAYGPGIDFRWIVANNGWGIAKRLVINQLSDLPTPNATILAGGNPRLRLQLGINFSNGIRVFIDGTEFGLGGGNRTRTTSGPVEFRNPQGETLFGFMPPRSFDSGGFRGNTGTTFTFRKQGNTVNVYVDVPWSWLQAAAFPVQVDADFSVAADADDGDSQASGSGWNATSFTTMIVGKSGSSVYHPWFGVASVTVPQAATIDSATITYICGATTSTDLYSDIWGMDEDNHAEPTSGAEYVTDRGLRTTATTVWDTTTNFTGGNSYTSPSIVSIIQEIVDRAGWSSGNTIGIHQDADGAQYGFNAYVSWASEKHATYAPPELNITYSTTTNVTLPHHNAAPTFYGPTVDHDYPLVLPNLDASPTFYAFTISATYGVTLPQLSAAPTFYGPTIAHNYDVAIPNLDASATFYAITIDLQGATEVTLPNLDAAPTFYGPTISHNYDVALNVHNATPTFYGPTLTFTKDLTLPHFDASPTLYGPTLGLNYDVTFADGDAYFTLDNVNDYFGQDKPATFLDGGTTMSWYAKLSLTDWDEAAGNVIWIQDSLLFVRILTDGTLNWIVDLNVANDSINPATKPSSVFTDGEIGYLRGTWTAGGTFEVEYSTDGSSWSSLGTSTPSSGVTIELGIDEFLVGRSATNYLDGDIYEVVVYSDAAYSTKVIDFDADDYVSGTSWTDPVTTDTWRAYGGAESGHNAGTSGTIQTTTFPGITSITLGATNVAFGTYDASPTFYAITIDLANTVTLPNLDASPTFYAITLDLPYDITLPQLDASVTLYGPTLDIVYPVTLPNLDASPTFYAIGVVAGTAVTLPNLDASPTFYAITLDPGAAPITLDHLNAAPTFYGPTLTIDYSVTLPSLDASVTFYNIGLDAGAYSLTLPNLDASATFYSITIDTGLAVTLPQLDAVPTFYGPTIDHDYPLTVGAIDASATFFTITLAWEQFVTLPLLDASPTIPDIQVLGGDPPDSGGGLLLKHAGA